MNSEPGQRGFTLIEVLVAFAIAAVAFVAMFSGLQHIVNSTSQMQERTFASWIAFDQITELRVAGEFPSEGKRTGEIELAGVEWLYELRVQNTESPELRQVIVEVAPSYDPELTLGRATGVLYQPPVSGGAPSFGAPGAGSGAPTFGNSGALLISSAPGSYEPAIPEGNPDDEKPEELRGQEH